VSAVFIPRTLFLVFVEMTSSKTSSRVIPQNNSLNNFLRAMFSVKSGKTTALKKIFEELFEIRRYEGLRISSGNATKIVSSRTFLSFSISASLSFPFSPLP
jgi:hypothetical protein